ncbi:MAG: phage tail protein [Nitrospinae bacterium]|nr:phage tail protein [Nitrospinota bacterium]
MLKISVDLQGLKEAEKVLDPKQYQKAVTFSLNRAVKSGRTEASEQIRKGDKPFTLKKSDVDRKMNLRLATQNNNTAILEVTSEPWLLSYFKPRQIAGGIKTVIKRTKKGFELLKGKGRKLTGGVSVEIIKGDRNILKKAFIISGKGGTPLVVWRDPKQKSSITGKDKLRVYKVYSLPSMFKKPAVIGKVINKIKTQWAKEFTSAVNRITSGKWNIGE